MGLLLLRPNRRRRLRTDLPVPKLTTPLAKEVDMADGNKAIPGATHDGATSPGRANPVTQVVGNISSALGESGQGSDEGRVEDDIQHDIGTVELACVALAP